MDPDNDGKIKLAWTAPGILKLRLITRDVKPTPAQAGNVSWVMVPVNYVTTTSFPLPVRKIVGRHVAHQVS